MAILVQSNKKPSVSFPSQTGSIVTFNSQYAGLPLKSHKIALTATQNGYSAINISHSDADTSNPTVHTIQIGSTVYGGEYDARTGLLTVTHGKSLLNDLSWVYQSKQNRFYSNSIASTIKLPIDNYHTIDMRCEFFENHGLSGLGNNQIAVATSGNVFVKCDYDNETDFMNNCGNYVFIYELATPTTIQLPPCPIDTLQGVNNIWADTGDTTVQYIKIGG